MYIHTYIHRYYTVHRQNILYTVYFIFIYFRFISIIYNKNIYTYVTKKIVFPLFRHVQWKEIKKEINKEKKGIRLITILRAVR